MNKRGGISTEGLSIQVRHDAGGTVGKGGSALGEECLGGIEGVYDDDVVAEDAERHYRAALEQC